MSTYPTIDQVRQADHVQICRWYRFLPSPGSKYIGTSVFSERLESEGAIMDIIVERFRADGGFTPEISKMICW